MGYAGGQRRDRKIQCAIVAGLKDGLGCRVRHAGRNRQRRAYRSWRAAIALVARSKSKPQSTAKGVEAIPDRIWHVVRVVVGIRFVVVVAVVARIGSAGANIALDISPRQCVCSTARHRRKPYHLPLSARWRENFDQARCVPIGRVAEP